MDVQKLFSTHASTIDKSAPEKHKDEICTNQAEE